MTALAAGEPDTNGLYGREERLVDAGYTVRKDATEEHATPDYPDGDPVREAAAELTASREEPFDLSPAEFIRSTVGIDEKEAITVRQAADDLASAGAELSRYVEGADLYKIAEEIDAKRAEAMKGDPELAKHSASKIRKMHRRLPADTRQGGSMLQPPLQSTPRTASKMRPELL